MTKLFGNKAQRDIRAIKPFVEEINRIYPSMASLSNDELRAKTQELKKEIQDSATDLRHRLRRPRYRTGHRSSRRSTNWRRRFWRCSTRNWTR